MIVSYDARRRRKLAAAIARALPPSKHTMVRELAALETPGHTEPTPEQMLFWMRLNMPLAAQRVEEILHPAD